MKTIRETVTDNIADFLEDAARKSHEMNYEFLLVDTDGELCWIESIDSYRVFDEKILIRVGTGSCGCNCDFCSEGSEPEFESDEFDYYENEMLENLENIDIGYFADEEGE